MVNYSKKVKIKRDYEEDLSTGDKDLTVLWTPAMRRIHDESLRKETYSEHWNRIETRVRGLAEN